MDNRFEGQENSSLHSMNIQSNDSKFEVGGSTEKFRKVCEHILNLLNETGNFSPKTRRFLRLKDSNESVLRTRDDIDWRQTIPEELQIQYDKPRKRKSTNITPGMRYIKEYDNNVMECGYDSLKQNHGYSNVYLSNYGNSQGTSYSNVEDQHTSQGSDFTCEVSPTVSPLPRSYSPSVGYISNSNPSGDVLFDGYVTPMQPNPTFHHDTFSQDFTNYYFSDGTPSTDPNCMNLIN